MTNEQPFKDDSGSVSLAEGEQVGTVRQIGKSERPVTKMVRVRCPTSADPADEPGCDHRGDACTSIIGCGKVFEDELDREGLLDCECGIWFTIEEGTNALNDPLTHEATSEVKR